jgi:hypothetical protein
MARTRPSTRRVKRKPKRGPDGRPLPKRQRPKLGIDGRPLPQNLGPGAAQHTPGQAAHDAWRDANPAAAAALATPTPAAPGGAGGSGGSSPAGPAPLPADLEMLFGGFQGEYNDAAAIADAQKRRLEIDRDARMKDLQRAFKEASLGAQTSLAAGGQAFAGVNIEEQGRIATGYESDKGALQRAFLDQVGQIDEGLAGLRSQLEGRKRDVLYDRTRDDAANVELTPVPDRSTPSNLPDGYFNWSKKRRSKYWAGKRKKRG